MKPFIKNTENFTCEKCNFEVIGDGYTNHCPHCLWSKHVDINPGDRASNCGCLMEPISYDKSGEEVSITHKCICCGHEKKNKISEDDNFDKIIKI
jgi:hypothetical protein